MDIITLYLLIGSAHWAQHILQCENCRDVMIKNLKFGLEGVCFVLGWPVMLIRYIREKPEPEITAELIELEVIPGETKEQFKKRLDARLVERLEEKRKTK